MKKFIIGALALATIGIGGFFVKTQIVDADTFVPNMSLTVDKPTVEVISYVDQEFTVDVTIDPDKMPYVNSTDSNYNKVKNVYLEVNPTLGLTFKGANVEGKFIAANNNKVNLADITYTVESTNVSVVAPDIKVELVFSGNVSQKFDGVGEVELFYEENVRVESPKQANKALNPAEKPVIKIGTLDYTGGKILGMGINDSLTDFPEDKPLQMPLNRYFDLNYLISPGKLTSKMPEEEIARDIELEEKERHLIYVIDKAAIEFVGGNEEIARDSIKQAISELATTNPSLQTSLIVYGKEAKVVEVNKKKVFSVQELLKQIDSIEATQESGNLGDAMRKAKIISDETVLEDSIVVVSAGNPNYYTQVSEGNSQMLSTMVDKEGFVSKDRELAEVYVESVAKQIIGTDNGGIRWYGVNYKLSKNETVLNDVLGRMEGNALKVQKPYAADFTDINSKAVSPISIQAKLNVESHNESIQIYEEDKKRDIELQFSKDENGNIVPIDLPIKVRARLTSTNGQNESLGFNVADPKEISVKLNVKYNEIDYTYTFNDPKDATANNVELKTWWVIPDVPYVANIGLFNGRITLGPETFKGTVQDVQEVQAASAKVLDELEYAELALENSFGYGMLIKTKTEEIIKPVLRLGKGENAILGATPSYKVYELEGNKFKDKGSCEKLKAGTLYLITIDHYIDGTSPSQKLGDTFEIGIEVQGPGIQSGNANQEQETQTEQNTNVEDNKVPTNKPQFWGIEVKVVDKPEHF